LRRCQSSALATFDADHSGSNFHHANIGRPRRFGSSVAIVTGAVLRAGMDVQAKPIRRNVFERSSCGPQSTNGAS
jgi:hypothetical protein